MNLSTNAANVIGTAIMLINYKGFQDQAKERGLCKYEDGQQPSGLVGRVNSAGDFIPVYTHHNSASTFMTNIANWVISIIAFIFLIRVNTNPSLNSVRVKWIAGITIGDMLAKVIMNRINIFFQNQAKSSSE